MHVSAGFEALELLGLVAVDVLLQAAPVPAQALERRVHLRRGEVDGRVGGPGRRTHQRDEVPPDLKDSVVERLYQSNFPNQNSVKIYPKFKKNYQNS